MLHYSLLLLFQFFMKTLPSSQNKSHFRLKLVRFQHQNHKSCFREIFRSQSVYDTFQTSEKQNNFSVTHTWIIEYTTHFLQKDLYTTSQKHFGLSKKHFKRKTSLFKTAENQTINNNVNFGLLETMRPHFCSVLLVRFGYSLMVSS